MSHDSEKDFPELGKTLRESRPTPDQEFTEQLDQAVADQFPPKWADEAALGPKGKGGVGSRAERFRRWFAGNRTVIPALAGTVGVLFVVAVVLNVTDTGYFSSGSGDQGGKTIESNPADAESDGLIRANSTAQDGIAAMPESTGVYQSNGAKPDVLFGDAGVDQSSIRLFSKRDSGFARSNIRTLASKSGNRDVARAAEITLAVEPSGVQEVANEVVEVTDKHKGIVMDSKVTDGEKGKAGASFSLLIPTGEVESAVADLSGIANLRSRSQELTDITKPVKKAEDRISDSKAKIKGLQGQLEETYDEAERAKLERRIRWEKRDLGWYETRLKKLERRIEYTPVGLEVETGGDTSSDDSSWGIGDAFEDAGKLLGVAAGVTVVALAVAIPIGIVILLVLALNRAWVRRARNRALDQD